MGGLTENVNIEQVSDVPAAKSLSRSRVKVAKKIALTGKPCIYVRDMECRAPVCDMDMCSKCPEGSMVCMKINFIKKMVSRILIFVISLLLLSE